MPDFKPTILLSWGYTRHGWIEPFEKLKHRFNFVYVYYAARPDNEVRCTDCKIIYWDDFASPFHILDEVKPDKVLYMGIYSGYDIALNIASKKRKIPTYVYQHGITQEYEVYKRLELKTKKEAKKVSDHGPKKQALIKGKSGVFSFLTSTLSFKEKLFLPFFALYFYLQNKKGKYVAAKSVPFRFRMPDYYICYTRENARIYQQTDNPDESKFIFTGSPEYDKYFSKDDGETSPIFGKYYLFISQPLAGNQYYHTGISAEKVNKFHLKLNDFCLAQGAKLVIKLHPESYNDTRLLQHNNIQYIRDEFNIISVIKGCEGCFGFFSSLLIPAIYYKPTVIFRLLGSSVQQHLIKLGVVSDLDFEKFSVDQIDFNKVKKTGSESEEFIADFLYKNDGKATERLAAILES